MNQINEPSSEPTGDAQSFDQTAFQGSQVPPANPSTAVPPAAKVLERKDGMIAGVAGGLADYLNVNVTAIRLLLVGLTVLTGGPLLPIAYLVAWIVIPAEGRAPRKHTTA